MFKYMEHANLTVSNVEDTESFLKLMFPEFERRGGGETDTKVWSHFGTETTYIALEAMKGDRIAEAHPYRDPRINHVGWVVEDVEVLRNRAIEAGYEAGELHLEGDGPHRKRVYVFDNNRLEWEFVEYLSESDSERNVYL